MDDAKAIINLREGLIELQGPVDFVRYYLDRYQSAISGPRDLPGGAPGRKKEAGLPKKKRGARRPRLAKGKRGSCVAVVRGYVEAGFLDEPRSMAEVRRHLNEDGLSFTDNVIRASLRKLCEAGALQKSGTGRGSHYQRAVQSEPAGRAN